MKILTTLCLLAAALLLSGCLFDDHRRPSRSTSYHGHRGYYDPHYRYHSGYDSRYRSGYYRQPRSSTSVTISRHGSHSHGSSRGSLFFRRR
ncbi:MAG: hypothetical protein ABMA13_17375 [Chthoniobacteraceae bacterium]